MRPLGMLIFCTQLCVFLASLMVPTVNGAPGCPAGWFGVGCRLRCNCEHSLDCGVGGQCPNNGPCKSPYFGLGCQYVDSLQTHATADTPMFVRDRNHSTCNPDRTATSLRVSLVKPHSNIWFTIHASNEVPLFRRNITITADQETNSRVNMFKIKNANALELRTDYSSNTLTNITIEGPVVPYICTINMSKGRNVALKQLVSQSSNYSRKPLHKVRAENAIDGNTVQNDFNGTCSHTEFETGTYPYWNITLDKSYYFHMLVIYNSLANMSWLSGFNLSLYDDTGNPVYRYKDTQNVSLPIYSISPSQNLARSVRIEADHSPSSRRVLVLCEVELYVETRCLGGTYGLDCEHRCNCKAGVRCSVSAGTCSHTPKYDCPPGTYGEMCEVPCFEHCGFCDVRSGACTQCAPGYLGQMCDQICAQGAYGLNCSLTCPERCAQPCDHTDGSCTCIERFAGHLCTECNKAWYGDNCSKACPTNCFDRMCDNITGECVSCSAHFMGPMCDDCNIGWFGSDCSRACPKNCLDRKCDNITGDCVSCLGQGKGPKCEDCNIGWFGSNCSRACPKNCLDRKCDSINGDCVSCLGQGKGPKCEETVDGLPFYWFLIPIIPLVLLTLFCFGYRRRNVHPEGGKRRSMNKPGETLATLTVQE